MGVTVLPWTGSIHPWHPTKCSKGRTLTQQGESPSLPGKSSPASRRKKGLVSVIRGAWGSVQLASALSASP